MTRVALETSHRARVTSDDGSGLERREERRRKEGVNKEEEEEKDNGRN